MSSDTTTPSNSTIKKTDKISFFERLAKKYSQNEFYNYEYSWSKEGVEIIKAATLQFTFQQKRIIKTLLLTPLPPNLRREYWLIATGAKREIRNNKNYYFNLTTNYPDCIPNPYENQIDWDICRTFPEDPYFSIEENRSKWKKVLLAYSRRCVSIGYCQGFNFIVGKILKICENEEETFWIFTQVIEHLLPINYFSELAAMLTDCTWIIQILKNSDEEIFRHLERINADWCLNNLIYKWFLSWFTHPCHDKVFLQVWDLFVWEGNMIIFKAAFAMVRILAKNIMECQTMDSAQDLFDNKLLQMAPVDKLIYYWIIKRFDFDSNKINQSRRILLPKIIQDIKLNGRFNINLKEDIECECDWDFPLCVKDMDYKHDIKDIFVYRTLETPTIIMDYYNNIGDYSNNNASASTIKEHDFINIVIERRKHVCGATTRSIVNMSQRNETKDKNVKLNKKVFNTINNSQESIYLLNEDAEKYGTQIQSFMQKIAQESDLVFDIPKQSRMSDDLMIEKV